MASPAAVLSILVEANTSKATASLRSFDRTMSRTTTTQRAATSRTTALNKATGTLGRSLWSAAKYAGGAAAAYMSISQAKAAVTTTQDLAKATAGLNRNLGFSVKQGSRWAAVAKARDIDVKSLNMSFTTLSRRVVEAAHAIREGGGAAESAMVPFTRLGLSQREVLKGSQNLAGFLPQLANAFGEAEGGAKRQASAQQLLGRGYQTILPLFSSGAKGLREQLHWADEYGATLSNKTVKAQMELVSAQRESKMAWIGLQVAVGKFLTPALQTANEQFQKVARILNSPELSNAEKLERIGQIIEKWGDKALDAFTAVLPKIVSMVGARAPKIASAFVRGFLEAPILGKLALGAWLFSRLGGGIGGWAGRIGTRFGTSFSNAAGPIIGAMVASAFAGAEVGKTLDIGQTDFSAKMAKEFDITLKHAQRVEEWMRNHPGIGFVEAMDQLRDAQRAKLEPFREKIKQLRVTFADTFGQIRTNLDQNLEQIKNSMDTKSGRARDLLRANFDAAAHAIDQTMGRKGPKATERGLNLIEDLIRKRLSMMGIKGPDAEKIINASQGGFGGHQTGGVITVPGTGNGDKVPAMLEPGEVVVNKKAVQALGGAGRVNQINDLIPRFATGGIAGDVAGLNPGIRSLVASLSRFGAYVTSGARPTDSDSLHSTGNAADLTFADWGGATRAVNAIGSKLLEGIYNPSMFGGQAVSWDSGQRVPPSFWGAGTWAGHADHLHAAILSRVGEALKGAGGKIKLPRFSSPYAAFVPAATGLNAYAGAAEKIIGQRAMRSGQLSHEVGVGFYDGPLNKTFPSHMWNEPGVALNPNDVRTLASRAGLPGRVFQLIAKGESGYRPGVISADGGYGLWQMTPRVQSASTVEAWKRIGSYFNPWSNAQQAKYLYERASSQTPNTPGFPWFGTQYLQHGGIAGFAKGTKGGGKKRPPKSTLPLEGMVFPGSTLPTSGSLGYQPLPPGLDKALKALRQNTAVLQERIANRQILDAMFGSEADEELGTGERAGQVALYDQLIATFQERIGKLKKAISFAPGGPRAGRFRQELEDIQGITGKGGLLLQAIADRASLLAPGRPAPEDTTSEQLSLTQELLRLANLRYGVSQAQYSVLGGMQQGGIASASVQIFHNGGSDFAVKVNGESVKPNLRNIGNRPLPSSKGY